MAGNLQELIAGQDQFGDEEHDALERGDRNADRLGPRLRGSVSGGAIFLARRAGLFAFRLLGLRFDGFEGGCEHGLRWLQPRGREAGVGLQGRNQIVVIALGFFSRCRETGENVFDAIDGRQCQRHGFRGRWCSIPQFADQRFRAMRQMLEARQTEKAACSLDRMEQAENPDDCLAIPGIPLEQHQLLASGLDMLARLDEKIVEQVVHRCAKSPGRGQARRRIIAQNGLRSVEKDRRSTRRNARTD